MAMSISKRIVAGVAALMVVASLSACGGSSASSNAKKPGSLAEVKNSVKKNLTDKDQSKEMHSDEATDESGNLDSKLVSLAATLDASSDQFVAGQSEITSVHIHAKAPNTLVMEYQMAQDLDATLFQQAINASGIGTLETIAKSLKQVLAAEGVDDASIRIVYIDSAKEELFAQTF